MLSDYILMRRIHDVAQLIILQRSRLLILGLRALIAVLSWCVANDQRIARTAPAAGIFSQCAPLDQVENIAIGRIL